ncbi:hypothetical protein [Citrobacter sedlakii]
MNGDNPAPRRPLVALQHKGPLFYLSPIKKNRRITDGECLHG